MGGDETLGGGLIVVDVAGLCPVVVVTELVLVVESGVRPASVAAGFGEPIRAIDAKMENITRPAMVERAARRIAIWFFHIFVFMPTI